MTNSLSSTKSAEAYRTIGEVADALKLPQHVLRFWETRFTQIKPLKRGGGRRFYRPEDIELLMAIRQLLYGEGYTIKGVQRMLKENGPRTVVALARERGASRVAEASKELLPIMLAPSGMTEQVEAERFEFPEGDRMASHDEDPETSGKEEHTEESGLAFLRAQRPAEQARSLLLTQAQDPVAQLRSVLADLAECRILLDATRA